MAVDKDISTTTLITTISSTAEIPVRDDDGVWKHGVLSSLDLTQIAAFNTLSAQVTALTASVAALTSNGGVLSQHNTAGTAITNSVVDTQFDNYAANAGVPLVSGDRVIYNMVFNLLNNSGSSVNMSMKMKIFGANTFQLNTIAIPAAAGVQCCSLFCEFTQGTSSSNHPQYTQLIVCAPNTTNSTVAGGTTFTEAAQSGVARVWLNNYITSATDYGATQQQFEVRFVWGTAAATIQAQRLQSTLSIIKAP